MCASYSNATNVTIDRKRFSKEGLTLSNCKNSTVSNCDFTYNSSTKTMCYLSNCQGCKVINSKFYNKSTIGVALIITGEKTKDNLVEGCEFYNLTYSDGNGGEPIRIGNSDYSGCSFLNFFKSCINSYNCKVPHLPAFKKSFQVTSAMKREV
jgi:hypothetical protein